MFLEGDQYHTPHKRFLACVVARFVKTKAEGKKQTASEKRVRRKKGGECDVGKTIDASRKKGSKSPGSGTKSNARKTKQGASQKISYKGRGRKEATGAD